MASDRFTGSTSRVWLALLQAGGRLTATEVAALADDVAPDGIRALLHALSRSGAARKYEDTSPMRYGVTPACRVPMGVTIGDILAATQGEPA